MALVIPPNHYQVLLPMQHESLPRSAAITFGIRDESATGAPQDIADTVLVDYSSAFITYTDPDVTVGPARLTFDQGEQGRGSVDGTASFVGTSGATDAISANVAVLVRKITARVGRPGRGRMFLPWMVQNDAVNELGVISGSALTNLQGRVDTFLTNLQTSGLEMVILHDENVPGTTTPSLVTELTVDPRVGTQRRRLR